MTADTLGARVFVSCGQARDSSEIETAHRIAERMSQLGFVPYIALEDQALQGIRENIFDRLQSSEYFLFVDFRRERLDSGACRGSLFSHQELAVASYLGLDVLAFREAGVMPEDGLSRFLQLNAVEFTDRHLLPSVVADHAVRRWNPRWRNGLTMAIPADQFLDATFSLQPPRVARYFFIAVGNFHRSRAVQCYAYLRRVRDLDTDRDIAPQSVELKWSGYVLPNAVVFSGRARYFDAFSLAHDEPTVLRFNAFTDSTAFVPSIRKAGDYEITYSVIADNSAVAEATFRLALRQRLEDTTFSPA